MVDNSDVARLTIMSVLLHPLSISPPGDTFCYSSANWDDLHEYLIFCSLIEHYVASDVFTHVANFAQRSSGCESCPFLFFQTL